MSDHTHLGYVDLLDVSIVGLKVETALQELLNPHNLVHLFFAAMIPTPDLNRI